jgi:glutamine synthetase
MPTPSDSWFDAHPLVQSVRTAACDLNGIARGKRMPVGAARKVLSGGVRFPFSVLNLDIWGEDIDDSPLVFETGDRDGTLLPTERGPVPMPWLPSPSALLPISMYHGDGRPFAGDPRHALRAVVDRFEERGLTPVVALEMEFYLVDDSGDMLHPPVEPLSGKRRRAGDVLSVAALDAFDDLFTALYESCEAMGIPADSAISEAGPGQFELNLLHTSDVMRAADDAWLFKMLVKGLARRRGLAASFMAKPYADQPGSGMHAHVSLLDASGRNLFDDGGPRGTDLLRQAVAGCVATMSDSTLIFAPHENSYHRLVPGAHAPTGICWAYENRTAAIRVPAGNPAARRIEHRVAGADANPYLLLAAVLGAILTGIEDGAEPPEPITGNAYALDLPQVPDDWAAATTAFAASDRIARIFAPDLVRNLTLTKEQELREMARLSAAERLAIYLETV